jgi:hypothetical protein
MQIIIGPAIAKNTFKSKIAIDRSIAIVTIPHNKSLFIIFKLC